MKRTLAIGMVAAALAVSAAGCGSSGDGASSTTTEQVTTTTEPATTTTEAAITTEAVPTTELAPATTTTPVTPSELPDCQVINQEYADVFTPDNLLPAAAFFRKYAPLMPAEEKAAVLRIAAVYESADGDMSKLNFDDQDLTADATAFTDWITAGCPAG